MRLHRGSGVGWSRYLHNDEQEDFETGDRTGASLGNSWHNGALGIMFLRHAVRQAMRQAMRKVRGNFALGKLWMYFQECVLDLLKTRHEWGNPDGLRLSVITTVRGNQREFSIKYWK